VTISHKNKAIKEEESLRGRRMDCAHYSLALFAGDPLEQLADAQSFESIQT